MSKSESAVEEFTAGFSCSQAVFASHAADYGIARDEAYRLAAAFGGGMAYHDQACGAVTAALMLIGLRLGKTKSDDAAAKERTNAAVSEFITKFKESWGSIRCTELLRFNLSDPEELRRAREAGVFGTICPRFVGDAVRLLEEIL